MTKKFKTFISKLQKEKDLKFLAALSAALFLLFLNLFSLAILQSDDYYYASFWRNGPIGFLKLTKDHFETFNGRAVVHMVAQTVLSLPSPFFALTASLIFSGIILLSCKFLKISKYGLKSMFFFSAISYTLPLLLGRELTRETLMWISAYFNYVMPLLFLAAALILLKNASPPALLLAFLAGASTEQWGAASITAIGLYTIKNMKVKKPICFLPALFTMLGYATIFLSPATRLRIADNGRFLLSELVQSFFRYSDIFINKKLSAVIILIFIAAAVSYSLINNKMRPLLLGIIPFLLTFISFYFKAFAPAAFLTFLCYLLIAVSIFIVSPYSNVSYLIAGAFSTAAVIIPTNTYEPRIIFPMTLLLIISSGYLVTVLFNELTFLSSRKEKVFPFFSWVFALAALVIFMPSYQGFKHNRLVEDSNISSVQTAKKNRSIYLQP